jgi:hypothetical protein
MARSPTRGAGSERLERTRPWIIGEFAVAPSVRVRESLRVLYHELYRLQGIGHRVRRAHRKGSMVSNLFLFPQDLRYSGAGRERFAIARNTFPLRFDQHWITEDRAEHVYSFGLTDGDSLPVFVSLNSENARPFGTFKVYLSWPARINPARTERNIAMINIDRVMFPIFFARVRGSLQMANLLPTRLTLRISNLAPATASVCRSDVFQFRLGGDASTGVRGSCRLD